MRSQIPSRASFTTCCVFIIKYLHSTTPSDWRHSTAQKEFLNIVPFSLLFNSGSCLADRHFWAGKSVTHDCDSVEHRALKNIPFRVYQNHPSCQIINCFHHEAVKSTAESTRHITAHDDFKI